MKKITIDVDIALPVTIRVGSHDIELISLAEIDHCLDYAAFCIAGEPDEEKAMIMLALGKRFDIINQ